LQLFERIIPDEAGTESTLSVVVEKARRMERGGKIFFSYPSLISITELADRYITYGEMPSKAIDLLIEISSWAREKGISVLNKVDVVSFVGNKTGVSIGVPNKAESDKLANLEPFLHKRIVGQDEAVSSVANALRRVRSGITNPKRPFASFLFLGPTGVGKTETSKALAESFFGGENKMIRFDMSEYKEADALPTLLGSSSEMHAGLLANKIRDNPYGVLLLDEFEKASPDVRDLFLQVLDEGEFSDALGNKVNCKNLIIIATSNAGADMIWKMVEQKKDFKINKQENKNQIIDHLIETGVLKPELINRFDGVIIFHPLESSELDEVAKLMFKKLAARLKKDKQIEISIDPKLLDSLVKADDNQEFGARSINRMIQEKVEDMLARKILSGDIKAGDSIEIKDKDMI
jgi:ATP-dependent Clp protease ATP-binding subunit ClpC